MNAGAPLMLIDLRTTGLVRLGVSTEAARGKAQGQGRKLSQAIYDQTDAQGLIYYSRLTGGTCICIYDRALPGGLIATPVVEVTLLAGFVDALRDTERDPDCCALGGVTPVDGTGSVTFRMAWPMV